jgi:transposase
LSRRKFTKELKLAAIQQLDKGSSAAEVARAFEINPNPLHRWRKEFRHGPGNAFSGPGKRRWEEPRIAQLERKVGQQTLEIDFLKGCLQRIEEQRMLQALTGRPPLVHYIQKQIEEGGAMTALRICALGQITRARLYRLAPEAEHEDPDLDLRDQRIALEFPVMAGRASPPHGEHHPVPARHSGGHHRKLIGHRSGKLERYEPFAGPKAADS